jgi:hypothetical protein
MSLSYINLKQKQKHNLKKHIYKRNHEEDGVLSRGGERELRTIPNTKPSLV